MGAITRDLLSYAIGRNVSEEITLITQEPVANGDGSYNPQPVESQAFARVVALVQSEITRLAMAGITLQQGVSIAIVGELAKIPDRIIRADGTLLKIVQYTVEENATVMIADVPGLGSDGGTYSP